MSVEGEYELSPETVLTNICMVSVSHASGEQDRDEEAEKDMMVVVRVVSC